jgi:hypothetical protein
MSNSSVNYLSQRVSAAVASYGQLLGGNLKTNLIDPNGPIRFTSTQAAALALGSSLSYFTFC